MVKLSIIIITGMVGSLNATASDFEFFQDGIDFWGTKKATTIGPTSSVKRGLELPAPQPTSSFSWQTYLDPENKEFFKEGEYTPPEPFMEIVRNPTDQNLKLWFEYINRRNELSQRLQLRMKEFLAKQTPEIPQERQGELLSKISSARETHPEIKRYRFRMYFDSHCPHCKRMFQTLAELQGQGFMVEAKQVDRDNQQSQGLPFPVSPASPGEIQEKNIASVPVLLIGDLKKKVVYRLSGYQSVASIFQTIANEGGSPL